jgi:hypothetical protein
VLHLTFCSDGTFTIVVPDPQESESFLSDSDPKPFCDNPFVNSTKSPE